MVYKVNEIFTSILGEGRFIGMKAVFVRLSGCNCKCEFCDTDHSNSREMSLEELYKSIDRSLQGFNCVHVVFTGGEPLIQDLSPILKKLIKEHKDYIQIMIETNGLCSIRPLLPLAEYIHFGISPKVSRANMVLEEDLLDQFRTRSLKILYPPIKEDIYPEVFETYPATWFGVQPIVGPDEIQLVGDHIVIKKHFLKRIEALKLDMCHYTSKWHISSQIHKFLNLR